MPSEKTLALHKALQNPDFDFIDSRSKSKMLATRIKQIAESGGIIGLDTETTGLDPRQNRVRLIQIATPDYCLIVDLNAFRHENERQLGWFGPLLALKELLESNQPKVLQNAAFDLNFLKGEGIELGGQIFDTMIAGRIINNGSGAPNDLGSLIKRTLGVDVDKSLQKADWGGEITNEMLHYAARDSICLLHIYPVLAKTLQTSKTPKGNFLSDVFKLEMQILRPVASMQWHGFGVDRQHAEVLQDQLIAVNYARRDALVQALDDALRENNPDDESKWLPRDPDGSFNLRAKDSGKVRDGTKKYKGFNPDSPMQMAQRLSDAGVLLRPNEKGKLTVDQNLMAFVVLDMRRANEDTTLIEAYLEWKSSATQVKHINTLLEAIGPTDRIHASYRQLGAETGRLSCAGPNLQQVPADRTFRSLFRAEKGNVLVVADFSQVELRVGAALSGEPNMVNAYREGADLHRQTAALMLNKPPEEITKVERQSAKIANFGLLFGAGPGTLLKQAVSQYGLDWTIDDSTEIVQGFKRAYPTLVKWQYEVGNSESKAIFTRFGRRRMTVSDRSGKYTTRINTEVQGTAGDIAKLAILRLWKYMQVYPNEAILVAAVHDELVLEVRESVAEQWKERLIKAMELAGAQLIDEVPIIAEADIGETWADAK